jgi:hypothetical protein
VEEPAFDCAAPAVVSAPKAELDAVPDEEQSGSGFPAEALPLEADSHCGELSPGGSAEERSAAAFPVGDSVVAAGSPADEPVAPVGPAASPGALSQDAHWGSAAAALELAPGDSPMAVAERIASDDYYSRVPLDGFPELRDGCSQVAQDGSQARQGGWLPAAPDGFPALRDGRSQVARDGSQALPDG